MKPTASSLVLALMAFPLAINAAAVPATAESVARSLSDGEAVVDPVIAPVEPENVEVDVNAGGSSVIPAGTEAELEKRQHCTLRLRWTKNWTELGARYQVQAHAIPDGGTYWNSWAMAESWAWKCKQMPHTNWSNNAQSWQDKNDPAIAYCDVSFIHGDMGYNQYKAWHQGAANSWARDHPGCIVEMNI